MNDQDRQLLANVLHQAGTAGIQGFDYVVRYKAIDGITSIIGFSVAIAGAVWCIRKVLVWEVQEEAAIAKGAALVILCAGIFGFICGAMGGINSLIAPQGAAILSLLGK